MQKRSYILANVPTKTIELPKDEAAKNKKIAEILKQMVLNSRKSRLVRQFTIQIIKKRDVAPKDYLGEIRAVYEYVRDEVDYRRDATFLDTFVTPDRMVRDILFASGAADCDDKALLLASMLLHIGQIPRFVLTNNSPGGSYSHIYVEVKHPKTGEWIGLETTEPVEMGWSPPTYKRGIINIIDKEDL